jgi:hypothetical protein
MSGYDMRPNAAALRREPDVEGPAELVGKRFVRSGRLLARACFFSCVIALATVGLSVALRKEDAVSQGCDACTIPDSLTLRKDVLVPNVKAACQASTCSCKSPVLPTEVCGKPAFIALVHVGKTGGSTIGAALAQANLDFWQIHGPDQVSHFTTSCHDKYTHYIFTHRDPVTRAISAFNWQSYDSKGIKNAGGDLYTKVYDECFPTANTFAEGLGEEGECGDLARKLLHDTAWLATHINTGPSFYIMNSAALKGMYQEGVRTYAVRTEHIEDDMQGLMDWLCLPRLSEMPAVYTESYPRKNDTELSELGRARLAAHVIEDYYANSAVGVLADNLPSEADVAWAE